MKPRKKSARVKLYQWRMAQKLSLPEAGERAGVKGPTWSEWESGHKRPSLGRAIDIELITDGAVKVEEFGYEDDVPNLMELAMRRISGRTASGEPIAEGSGQ